MISHPKAATGQCQDRFLKRGVRGGRAFTLIELLVVVTIITLLLTVLMPALRDAKEQSKRAACQTNLKNIWTGVLTYSLEYNDRVPFMEDVNLTDPAADPFDMNYPTTVGVVMLKYVTPGSWRCPSAVNGFPQLPNSSSWKMTYTFSSAGGIGEGVPYDDDPLAGTGGPLDPAVSNYVHFDGRPLRLLDGRRYVQSWGLNQNEKGYWNVRFPIISDTLAGDPMAGLPKYPHRGTVAARADLENARVQFETNTFGNGKKVSYHELHADGDQVDILLTRFWTPHWPGY